MKELPNPQEPSLPVFVKVVTGIDILLLVPRIPSTIAMWNLMPRLPQDTVLYLVMGAMVLSAIGLFTSLIGGILTLLHARSGPHLQAIAVAFRCCGLVFVASATLSIPDDQLSLAEQCLVMFVGSGIVLGWLAMLILSIRKTFSMFRLIDAGHEATIKDLDRVGTSVEFRELSLSRNSQAGDDYCIQLSRHRKLVKLDLSHTKVTDRGINSLVWLPQLARLDLSHTKVTDDVFRILSEAPALIDLRVDSTNCSQATGARFEISLREKHPWPATVRVSANVTTIDEADLVAPPDASTPQGTKPASSEERELNDFLSGLHGGPRG